MKIEISLIDVIDFYRKDLERKFGSFRHMELRDDGKKIDTFLKQTIILEQ